MTTGLLLAVPWILFPVVVALLVRRRPVLEDWPPLSSAAAPRVSVIIPARNEAHNLPACLDAVLATSYPSIEVVVVDDGSTDGTGGVIREAVSRDVRVTALRAGDLPAGWFGKPWACHAGARAASGSLLLFIDADVRLSDEAIGRAVAALEDSESDLLTGLPHQLLHSLAERLVMPMITSLILLRYPDPERVNRSPRTRDKIAVGGFLLVRRDAYEAVGGHAAVRAEVAEDLRLGQRMHACGKTVTLVAADRFVGVRMYQSLAEIVEGWSKNVAIASRQTVPRALRSATPWLLVLWLLVVWVAPPVGLVLGLVFGGSPSLLAWGATATLISAAFWATVYRTLRLSPAYAALYPFGALTAAAILLRSAIQGPRVEWKGRTYRTAAGSVEVVEDGG